MLTVHHMSCGSMQAPPNPKAVCHCLLLEGRDGLALVDTGIGMLDVAQPLARFGRTLIDMVGFHFDEQATALRRIERMGYAAEDVKHIILTHGDPDHAGGLADFPHAQVHVSEEEHAAISKGHWRYLPVQFEHGPKWRIHPVATRRWFGLEARTVPIGFDTEVLFILLFGHTLGHCGVAVHRGDRWLLHVGDAYYLRVELTSDDHPVSALAAQRADNDGRRRESLEQLRKLALEHAGEIDLCGYHDPAELAMFEVDGASADSESLSAGA